MTDFSDIPWKNKNSPHAGERQYFKWRLNSWLWETFCGIFWTTMGLLLLLGMVKAGAWNIEERDKAFNTNPEQFCKDNYGTTVARDIPGRCLQYFYTR